MSQIVEPILRVEGLVKHFPVTAGVFGQEVGRVRAVDGVSFEIAPGETLGLVGESGCGKTTVGRCILRLEEPTAGRIVFDHQNVADLSSRKMRKLRQDMQIIFQDPFSSLNPRMTVRDIIGEPLRRHRLASARETEDRVGELLRRVGLPERWMNRYPHEFSGGQRQRIGIARAIALNPKFIVCDEAVSALDVSVRAQVINLLMKLREELGLSYLFIAHDLSVVKHISHRIAVMYLGQIMAVGSASDLFERAVHPYTVSLLSAIPIPDPTRRIQRVKLGGDVPTPLNPPSGCRFHTRCPAAFDRCSEEEPAMVDLGGGHCSKCFLAYDVPEGRQYHRVIQERMNEKMAANRATSVGCEGESDEEEMELSAPPEAELRKEIGSGVDIGPWIGWAVVALGLVMAMTHNLWWGLGLALFAVVFIAAPLSRRQWLTAVVGAAIIGGGWFAGAKLREQRFEDRANEQRQSIAREVEAYEEAVGRPPRDIRELGWRLHRIFPDGRPVDPWGNRWRIEDGEIRVEPRE